MANWLVNHVEHKQLCLVVLGVQGDLLVLRTDEL